MAEDAGTTAYERAEWEGEWVHWRVACQHLSEAELCAAVLDGRLSCLMVVGESQFVPGRGDVDYPTRVELAPLPADFGGDWLIEGTSAPRLYCRDAYGREDKNRPRWKRLDGRAWPPHAPFFRFVVSRAALARLLDPPPRSMPELFRPPDASALPLDQQEGAPASANAAPQKRREKGYLKVRECKAVLIDLYPPDGIPPKHLTHTQVHGFVSVRALELELPGWTKEVEGSKIDTTRLACGRKNPKRGRKQVEYK